MKINFCNGDGGEIIFTKESEEIKDIISSIAREGTEINLFFSKNDFFHGYVSSYMYSVDEQDDTESLNIYISKEYVKTYDRIILEELQRISKKVDSL